MGSLVGKNEASLIKFIETTAKFKESVLFFTSLIKGDFQWFENTTKELDEQGLTYCQAQSSSRAVHVDDELGSIGCPPWQCFGMKVNRDCKRLGMEERFYCSIANWGNGITICETSLYITCHASDGQTYSVRFFDIFEKPRRNVAVDSADGKTTETNDVVATFQKIRQHVVDKLSGQSWTEV